MKRKILFVLTSFIIIVALSLSFNFVQGDDNGTSLESVTIMAEAQAYDPCPGWDGGCFWGWDSTWEDCIWVCKCGSKCV